MDKFVKLSKVIYTLLINIILLIQMIHSSCIMGRRIGPLVDHNLSLQLCSLTIRPRYFSFLSGTMICGFQSIFYEIYDYDDI